MLGYDWSFQVDPSIVLEILLNLAPVHMNAKL